MQDRDMGHGLSAGGAPVSAARGFEAHASYVNPRRSLPRRRLRETSGRKERTRGRKVKPVERNEIIDYVTYKEKREALRDEEMAAQAVGRVHNDADLRL